MQIQEPETLTNLIKAFNDSDNPKDRFAFAAALRVELGHYVDTLDDSILPMFQKAIADEARRKIGEKS